MMVGGRDAEGKSDKLWPANRAARELRPTQDFRGKGVKKYSFERLK